MDIPAEPRPNEKATVSVRAHSEIACDRAHLIMLMFDKEHSVHYSTLSTEIVGTFYELKPGTNHLEASIRSLPLTPGSYAIEVVIRKTQDQVPLAARGVDDQPAYFEVAMKDLRTKNVSAQNGDLLLLELEKS